MTPTVIWRGLLWLPPRRVRGSMLSEVGVRQGVEEARNIMEGVRSVRPDVLETLLKNCLRVKVIRLCVQWAEELNLDWAAAARNSAKGKHGTSRWSARLKDGTTLTLKPGRIDVDGQAAQTVSRRKRGGMG